MLRPPLDRMRELDHKPPGAEVIQEGVDFEAARPVKVRLEPEVPRNIPSRPVPDQWIMHRDRLIDGVVLYAIKRLDVVNIGYSDAFYFECNLFRAVPQFCARLDHLARFLRDTLACGGVLWNRQKYLEESFA